MKRLQLIEGLTIDEFMSRNADPLWLQQNELWEYMTPDAVPEAYLVPTGVDGDFDGNEDRSNAERQ